MAVHSLVAIALLTLFAVCVGAPVRTVGDMGTLPSLLPAVGLLESADGAAWTGRGRAADRRGLVLVLILSWRLKTTQPR
jgi:hypothetical protein